VTSSRIFAQLNIGAASTLERGTCESARAASPTSDRAGRHAAPPTFREVYDAHFDFVWRYASFHGVPRAGLDDVVQEVFIVVYDRLSTFEGRSSLRTWIAGVCHNVVRDCLRRRAVRPVGDPLESESKLESQARDPGDACELKSAAQELDGILDKMSEMHREVFILYEIEQMSAPDIADLLGVNENTVRTRLRAARKTFDAAVARLRAHRQWEERG